MTTTKATADLCDAHGEALQICEPVFNAYGGRHAFAGPASTVRCFEDNTRVKEAVDGPGGGRVLVVDGGGSRRRALFGGNLGAAAVKNGWAGVIIHGCIRDSAELAPLPRDRLAARLRPPADRERLGAAVAPKDIDFLPALPHTRSGKIMRRLLRSIAKGEAITQDTSTLENPAILDQLGQAY